ncbi:Ail/Lom family outer membrane beta-barrel protein [Escherichia coli]|nr:Ail/Lom family outer membrane beta-barrel protein [Escherichia coli]
MLVLNSPGGTRHHAMAHSGDWRTDAFIVGIGYRF